MLGFILRQKNVMAMRNVAMFVVTGLAASVAHAGDVPDPVFYLNFDGGFSDVSANNLPTDVGSSVSLVPGGGPTVSGGTLDSGRWPGTLDTTNRVTILDNTILDGIATSAGSVVTWVKVDNDQDRNSIFRTEQFAEFRGMELHTNATDGAFGAAQGWNGQPLGPGGFGAGVVTPTDTWTNLAMTWDAEGEATIWVNGEAGTPKSTNAVFGQNDPGEWIIGGRDNTLFNLTGELADFAIFDVTLTEAQIMEIMADGVPGAISPGQDGDFDGDLDVDGADFLKWQRDLGDASNLADWETNFGTPAAVAVVATVPEPASWILVCTLAMAVPRWRGRS